MLLPSMDYVMSVHPPSVEDMVKGLPMLMNIFFFSRPVWQGTYTLEQRASGIRGP